MKPLLITALLALAAPQADAGDWKVRFGFGYHKRGNGVRVQVGYKDGHRHRHRHRPRRVRHHCHKSWVCGHYVLERRKVHVPATYRRVHRPAEYEYRYDDCGFRRRVLVRPAGYYTEHVPAHYEWRRVKVWRRGYWVYNCNTPGHKHRHRHRH